VLSIVTRTGQRKTDALPADHMDACPSVATIQLLNCMSNFHETQRF